jgi:hypothetical protein
MSANLHLIYTYTNPVSPGLFFHVIWQVFANFVGIIPGLTPLRLGIIIACILALAVIFNVWKIFTGRFSWSLEESDERQKG